ncbi:MAG TPA: serine hydrolase [Candidatus Paceibacterota bacterium]
MIPENHTKSAQLVEILKQHGFTDYEMGIGIIDLKNAAPEIFGYNLGHFIYPASVYKVFIGAEMLRQIEIGNFSFYQKVIIKAPNDVDKDARIFPGDTRKLLNAGEEVTIDYLIDLMITRSDNTASNQLIDLVGRENIITNVIHANNWHGSEVTRKFLDRIKEDKKYQFSETTKTCARHVTEFMYLVETDQLISPFVSQHLKSYMERWSRTGRGGLSLPDYSIYRKGGYLETNLYTKKFTSLVKSIFTKGWAYICWMNDAAVITGKNSHYAISVFTVTKSLNPHKRFPLKKLAQVVYDFMENENS